MRPGRSLIHSFISEGDVARPTPPKSLAGHGTGAARHPAATAPPPAAPFSPHSNRPTLYLFT